MKLFFLLSSLRAVSPGWATLARPEGFQVSGPAQPWAEASGRPGAGREQQPKRGLIQQNDLESPYCRVYYFDLSLPLVLSK